MGNSNMKKNKRPPWGNSQGEQEPVRTVGKHEADFAFRLRKIKLRMVFSVTIELSRNNSEIQVPQ